MINKQTIEQYFTKEQIIKNLTSYILYYQVSLGRNVYETLQNQQETIEKLKALNLTLEPNIIVMKLLEIILAYGKEEHFTTHFDTYLQKKALIHSLEDFINNDAELLNKEKYFEAKQKKILEDRYFDSGMKMQYLKEYPQMLQHYEKIIDDLYVQNIQDIILNNLSQ